MRTMFDGIRSDAAGIARLGGVIELVAGYDDGLYAWSAADWTLFPTSVHVHIAVFATTNSGIVLDVEKGDATPAEAVNWVLMRRSAGVDPTVYCNASTWPMVREVFQAHGVREPHYWIAAYSPDESIPAGAVAHQWQTTADYDVSSVADVWPGVDELPVGPQPPAPHPTQPQEIDMAWIASVTPDPSNAANKGAGLFLVDGGKVTHIVTPGDERAFAARFGAPLVITPGQYDVLAGLK